MNCRNTRYLQIGDRVGFHESNVHADGVVIQDLGPEYVKVKWLDCRISTTHRRHALGFNRVTSLRELVTLLFGKATTAARPYRSSPPGNVIYREQSYPNPRKHDV
jgi:hypothetical protein